MLTRVSFAMSAILCLIYASNVRAAETSGAVKIMLGGPLVVKMFEARKATIENAAGTPIEIRTGPPDVSIVAMEKNLLDIACFTMDPAKAFPMVKQRSHLKISRDNYEVTEFSRLNVKIGLHPDNPAQTLTKDQIKGVLTGQITDWEQITGQKLPIKLVFAKNYEGTTVNVMKYYVGTDALPKAEFVIDKDGLLKLSQIEKGILFFIPSKETNTAVSPKYLDTDVWQVTYFLLHKASSPAAHRVWDYLKMWAKEVETK